MNLLCAGFSRLTPQEISNVRRIEKASPLPYSTLVTPQNLARYGLGGGSSGVVVALPLPPEVEVEALKRKLAEVEEERNALVAEVAHLREVNAVLERGDRKLKGVAKGSSRRGGGS